MNTEQERRAMQLLPRIEQMHEALGAGLLEIIKDPPSKPLPLFYLPLQSDDMVRPTVELCDALRGKTDTLWAKKPSETTKDEDVIRCVAIRRFLSFQTIADILADKVGGHSFDFEDHPNYRFITEIRRTHDGSDHIVQETLYVNLAPTNSTSN